MDVVAKVMVMQHGLVLEGQQECDSDKSRWPDWIVCRQGVHKNAALQRAG